MQSIAFNFEDTEVRLSAHNDPDHLFNVLKRQGTFYELDLLTAVREIYDGKSVIIDAGANIGNHTVFFSKFLEADVIAFEPFAKNRELLEKNIADNKCEDRVIVMPYALGEARGYGTSEVKVIDNPGNVTIHAAPVGDIEIVPLDDVLDEDTNVGVMKIDVEGFEVPLLKGAMKTLARCRPHLFAEAHTDEEFKDLKAILEPVGYRSVARYCATPTYHFKHFP